MSDSPVYEWSWNDEPDFALPHADHISVDKVWLKDDGTRDEYHEMCIIVVRRPYSEDIHSRAYAERRAMEICDALNAVGVVA